MTYIVLEPHSLTNNTSKFHVVHDIEWSAYIKGDVVRLTIWGVKDTKAQAQMLADQMNREIWGVKEGAE